MTMRTIAIHGRKIDKDSRSYVEGLFEHLHRLNITVLVSRVFKALNHPQFNLSGFTVYPDQLKSTDADYLLSLGGDGTLLETITHVGSQGIPILGINTGRLGFLATIAKEKLEESLELFFSKQFEIEERTLLQLRCNENIFNGHNYALNEFAILRKDTSSMIAVKCFLDGQYLSTYWADGLMVSTPTGSTGYSLSCGGPVVMPQTKNFLITPVSPHNLNVRPLIIPDSSELTFSVESRDTGFLISLDSRSATLSHDVELKVGKAPFPVKLVRIQGNTFLDTLRNKLGWGFDRRN
jgi:NAD+ kinase